MYQNYKKLSKINKYITSVLKYVFINVGAITGFTIGSILNYYPTIYYYLNPYDCLKHTPDKINTLGWKIYTTIILYSSDYDLFLNYQGSTLIHKLFKTIFYETGIIDSLGLSMIIDFYIATVKVIFDTLIGSASYYLFKLFRFWITKKRLYCHKSWFNI